MTARHWRACDWCAFCRIVRRLSIGLSVIPETIRCSIQVIHTGLMDSVRLSLLKISTGLREAGDFSRQPYRNGRDGDSLCRCIDLRFPFSQPCHARTQACRASASVGRFAPTTPRSTSAFISGSASMGVALPNLAASHRRDGPGQARNRGRVASQGLPVLLALAVTSSRTAQDQSRNSRFDPPHEQRQPVVGCAAHSRGVAQARHQNQPGHGWALDAVAAQGPLPDLA